jgi:hypothetical protein
MGLHNLLQGWLYFFFLLYLSINIIEVIKLRKMTWVELVARRGAEKCPGEKSIGVYGSTVSEEKHFEKGDFMVQTGLNWLR